jgi:nucleotide-binding universal stress UspA family protein
MDVPPPVVPAPETVVAYDGSPDADRAAVWAARLSAVSGEAVRALIVVDPVDMPHGHPWPEPWWRQIEDRARTQLGEAGAPVVHVERRAGPTTATLLEATASASMLVIGSRGHSLVGEFLLNSVSQRSARRASCPVVVVREPKDPMAHRVVVGVDGSEQSLRALDFACRLAALTQDTVSVLRAWRPGTVPVDDHGDVPTSLSTSVGHEKEILADVVASARLDHPGVEIEADFRPSDAGVALQEASDSADLVVVGARRMSAVEEAVLGSVSQHVLRHAHCTVAVVH